MSVSAFPDDLLVELRSRDHNRRSIACRDLGKRLARCTTDNAIESALEVINLLIPALADEHPQVRETAADSLTRGPTDRVESALLEALAALSSASPSYHRSMLVHVLGLLDRPCEGPLLEALLTALSDADSDVRFQAISSLNRLECGADEIVASLPELVRDDDAEVSAVAATAAADFGLAELLPDILERWRSARGFAKRHLALAAAYLGSNETIPSLEAAIRSGVDGLDSVEALLKLGGEPAVEKLRWAAKSLLVHPVLRARAGVALAELGTDDAAAIVGKHLKARRTELRCGTMEWIGRQQVAGFVPQLIDVLSNKKNRDSAVAAYSLGFSNAKEAMEPLRSAAESDSREDVREDARAALERLSEHFERA